MSTTRIKGNNGVIIESSKYLELPKGSNALRPANPRVGMIRYNDTAGVHSIESSVHVETGGVQTLEWRRVAHLDSDGKLLTSQLPTSITGSLAYKGTWDASIDDVNETSGDIDPPLDPLPAAAGKTGHYYIVRKEGDGNGAQDLASVPSADNPKYAKGDWIVSNGDKWEKVDHSQISTVAGQVGVTTTSMRNKHGSASATSLQDFLDGFVETAVDRNNGDVMTNYLKFDNTKDAARLMIKDGAASTPGMCFTTDEDTGLFRPGNDQLAISAGGTENLIAHKTRLVTKLKQHATKGSPSAPAYSFEDDTTSGIYNIDSSQLGFATAGTWRTTIYNDGLISTRYRGGKDLTVTTPTFTFDGDSTTGMYRTGAGSIGFTSAGNLKLKVHDYGVESLDQFLSADGSEDAPGYAFNNDANMGIARINNHLCFVNDSATQLAVQPDLVDLNVKLRNVHGSVGAPAYTFDGDEDTGIFRQDEGSVGISGGNKEVARFQNSRNYSLVPMQFDNGSATAPSIRFNDSTNSGLFQPEDGTVAITCSNKEVARFTATGLNSNKPIRGTGDVAQPALSFTANSDSGFYAPDSDSVALAINGVNKLTFTADDATSRVNFRAPRGTKAEVAYGFESDANTGMYSPGANKLGLVVSGRDVITVADSIVKIADQVQAPVGSHVNATPANSKASYAFIGDANTGMYRPGAEQIGFLANGVERFRIQSDSVINNGQYTGANGSAGAPHYSFAHAKKSGMYNSNTNVAFAADGTNVLTLTKASVQVHKPLHLGTQGIIWKANANTISVQAESNASQLSITAPSEARIKIGTGTPFYVLRSAIKIPQGTSNTADAPSNGMLRYNNAEDKFQGYYENKWQEIGGGGRVTNDGSAGTPGLYWENEPATGLFRPSAGALAVTTSAGERARFTATQTQLQSKLSVVNAGRYATIDATANNVINFNTSHKLKFNHDVEARSFLTSSESGVKSDGLLYQNGKPIQDICLQTVFGKSTTDVDLMLKSPGYNGCYQREDDPTVPGYRFGSLVNLGNNQARFQIWAPHGQIGSGTSGGSASSALSSMWIRTGYGNDIKAWRQVMFHGDTAGDATTVGGVSASLLARRNIANTFNGQQTFTYGSNTINHTDLSKSWLLVGSTAKGIGIDSNEVVSNGDHLYLTSISDNIEFRAAKTHVATFNKDKLTFFKPASFNSGITTSGLLSTGDVTIASQKKLTFDGVSDRCSIRFVGSESDNGNGGDQYLEFLASDNGTEYFKFKGQSGADINDWMDIKKDGIYVTGNSSKLGLYYFQGRDLKYNNHRVFVAYTGQANEPGKQLVLNYQNDFTDGVKIQGITTLDQGRCSRAPVASDDLANKAYVDSKVSSAGGGDASASKTLNFTSDSGGNWTTVASMAGKTYVGGWSGTAGAANNYVAIKNVKGETDLYVDGDIYVKTRERGRIQTHDKVLVNGDVDAYSLSAFKVQTIYAQGSDADGSGGISIGGVSSAHGGAFINSINDKLYLNEAGKRVIVGTTSMFSSGDAIPVEIQHHENPGILFTTPGKSGMLRYHQTNGYEFTHNGNTIVEFKTNGELIAKGNVVAFSDARIKTDVKVVDNALEKISLIRGVTYERTDIDTDRQAGVIAQEVEKVLPEVVSTTEDGTKAVAYGNLNALIIEAVKEEKAKREALEAEVAELKEMVKMLMKK